jgi:hypothetical protein
MFGTVAMDVSRIRASISDTQLAVGLELACAIGLGKTYGVCKLSPCELLRQVVQLKKRVHLRSVQKSGRRAEILCAVARLNLKQKGNLTQLDCKFPRTVRKGITVDQCCTI